MDLDGARCFVGFRTQFGDLGMHQLDEVSDDCVNATEVEFGSVGDLKLIFFVNKL